MREAGEAGAVPEVEAAEEQGEAGGGERPDGGAVAMEVVCVAGGHEGPQREVAAVADQAEAGEEAGEVAQAWVSAGREEEDGQGEERTPEGAAPRDELGVGVGGDVGAGEVEEGEGDLDDVSAGEEGVEAVAELVEDGHGKPGGVGGEDQQEGRAGAGHGAKYCRGCGDWRARRRNGLPQQSWGRCLIWHGVRKDRVSLWNGGSYGERTTG